MWKVSVISKWFPQGGIKIQPIMKWLSADVDFFFRRFDTEHSF